MSKKTRNTSGHPGALQSTSIGSRGHTVVAYERGESGKAYLRYSFRGRRWKHALGIDLKNAAGQLMPAAIEAVNTEQRRVLDCLLKAQDPYANAPKSPVENAGTTLQAGFDLFLGEGGPTPFMGPAQRKRYEQTQRQVVALWGPASSGRKPAGKFTPTRSAASALLWETENGYLSELERTYQLSATDYPLFPGDLGRLAPDAMVPPGDYKPMDRSVIRKVFLDVEKAAGVRHVAKRVFHGFRRSALDTLVEKDADAAAIQAAGNWSTIQVPMDTYRDGVKKRDRMRAATLLEQHAAPAPHTETGSTPAPAPQIEVVYPEAYPDLAQLLKAKNLTDPEVDEVLKLTKWAWVELNYRPHAYQACALTT